MKKTKYIFLIIGVVILGVMFYAYGVEKPLKDIVSMGWAFWAIVFIFLANHLFLTYGWWVLVSVPLKARYYFSFLMARIAGDSIAMVSSVAGIAGDPLRAVYLKSILPFRTAFASAILDRAAHGMGNITIIIIGIFIAFFKLNVPIWVLFIILGLFLFMFYYIIEILKKHEGGILQYLIANLPDAAREKLMGGALKDKIVLLDKEISFCFSSKKNFNHMIISVLMHSIPGLLACSLEIFLILKFIGHDISFLDASLVYLFGLIANMIIFFIPMNIGSSEGAYSISLSMLGFDPALGLSVGLIRRLRQAIWALFGMLLLFKEGLTKEKVEEVSKEKEADAL